MFLFSFRVLKEGYCRPLKGGEFQADGTITLIRGLWNLIVDTGGPWDRDFIMSALDEDGLLPSDINFVVCTHGHSDHTGNNNLFPNATLVCGFDVSTGDVYQPHDFESGEPLILCDDLYVAPTPGHTGEDVSVFVRTAEGMVAVVGDLFEHENDEDEWRSLSQFREKQAEHRKSVLQTADIIVPGHGPAFKVRK